MAADNARLAKRKEAGPMASFTSKHAGQYHSESMDMGYSESKFNRSAWEKIEHGKQNQTPVTIWIGVASVIVAIPIRDVDPDDLEVSVLGTRLLFRGTARSHYFSQDVDLPCDVDVHPIRITDGKGTLYILLVKKQKTDTVTAEGHGDRYPSIPILTISGA
jgi:HSP20 family molecular chaperone IbpA